MRGTEELGYLLNKYRDRPILVYGDPDFDGIASMLIVCEYLERLGLKYTYYVNGNRAHGFFIEPTKLTGYLVIAVDFDCVDELQSLVDADVKVVSIDHHDICSTYTEPLMLHYNGDLSAIVINNQYSFEPEEDRYLSGAGVVYEVLCDIDNTFATDTRKALVGITLLSDIRPIENVKAREYLKTTYNIDATSGYIGYLVDTVSTSNNFVFGRPRMDRNFIDYTLSPRINSLLRFNYTEEAINVIIGNGLRVLDTKERQTELVQIMRQRASYLYLDHITIIAVDESKFSDYAGVYLANFIGLLSSAIKGVGNSVLAFTFCNGVITRASFRGRYDDINYRRKFEEMGIEAQGHPSAFGVLNFKPSIDLYKSIDSAIGVLDSGHKSTSRVIDVSNLSFAMLNKGWSVATENCYVRDMFRIYFRYTGTGARCVKETFKMLPLTADDIKNGVKPDKVQGGIKYKYMLDADGNKVTKYREYLVDGQKVKSFGVSLGDGLILPILEKGVVQLYLKENILVD